MRAFLMVGAVGWMLGTGTASAEAHQDSLIGTVVVAHGGGPGWNALVEDVVQSVETGGPVAVSYLMGPAARDHRFQDVVRALAEQGASRVVVVPLLVSSHSGHYEQIRYLVGLTDSLSDMMHHHLHMAGIERPDVSVELVLTAGMDGAPEIAEVLTARAAALSVRPEDEALFVIGHGPSTPEDYVVWMQHVRALAAEVGNRLPFRDVRVGLLWDDSPPAIRAEAVLRIRELIELQAALTGRPVVVVPLLMSRGEVSDEKVPRDLEGLPVVYAGDALLPHLGVARWIESRVRDVTEAGSPAR